MNGVINLYKPKGHTSHDMIYKVRRALGIRRVGHTGTLDPMAEGVLPICVGKATGAAELIMASEKEYVAQMTFGIRTDTQDSTGETVQTSGVRVCREEFIQAFKSFTGEIMQTPPMYSAVHHNGKRLYELARKGITVERKAKQITVHAIELLEFEKERALIKIKCSKGTYIRTLCDDIGERLGCLAHMSALTRTKSGIFTIENAVSLENISPEALIPIDSLFQEYEKIFLTGEEEKKVRNGAPIKDKGEIGGKYRLYAPDGTFLCLSEGTEAEGKKLLRMVKSFY